MSIIGSFNKGELTSNTIDRQFSPEFVTKAVVEMPARKKTFSKRSNRVAMPKRHGDTLTKEIRLPMLHKDNMVDGNVDASVASIIKNEYARVLSATGIVVQRYSAENYLAADGSVSLADAQTAARNAAVAALGVGEEVKSTAGSILNGGASYALTKGPLAVLPEEGGVVNLLNGSSKLVSAKITFHGIATKYTVRSIELDSRVSQVATKIKELSRAVGELKEIQVQSSILSAAELNMMPSTNNAVVVDMSDLGGLDTLTYDTLTAFEQELLRDDVPMDTEMLTGVKLIDTKTVEDAYIAYVGREAIPILRNITGPNGELVWVPKSQYGAGTEILEGEQGSIGSFRFIVVPDLAVYRGHGVGVGHGSDTANIATQAAAYKTTKSTGANSTGVFYDVFPMIVIGDDSFSITGFGAESTSAKHIMPKADVHNDMYGEVGGVSSKWSYGFLPYRPERIKMLAFTATRNGKTA